MIIGRQAAIDYLWRKMDFDDLRSIVQYEMKTYDFEYSMDFRRVWLKKKNEINLKKWQEKKRKIK